jgi:hypothetical protein
MIQGDPCYQESIETNRSKPMGAINYERLICRKENQGRFKLFKVPGSGVTTGSRAEFNYLEKSNTRVLFNRSLAQRHFAPSASIGIVTAVDWSTFSTPESAGSFLEY